MDIKNDNSYSILQVKLCVGSIFKNIFEEQIWNWCFVEQKSI